MFSNVAVVFFSTLSVALVETPCEGLKTLSLSGATITAVELVPAGPFRPQGTAGQAPAAAQQQQSAIMLPAHCRVGAVLKPSSDSNIEMEVWLPAADWNGKFLAVGNGGWAGSISYPAMASALQERYATASNDTGHKGANASFALGHPEKLIDFAYRSMHEMTLKSKAIVTAFYGRGPRLSYYNGCSTGGRQGLMEAQRYPDDFEAIIAGAPANYQTHLHAWDVSLGVATLTDPAKFVPQAKTTLLNQAVTRTCDALDGVKDGLLTDPRKCNFDPSTLLCRGGDADNCLTAPQVEAVKKTYAPAKTRTGELIYPGYAPGSELGWGRLAGGTAPPGVAVGTFQVAYENANWDWRTFDLDRDTTLADNKAGFINAVDPNLQAFKARGGKLLIYHGWNDTAIAPENTVNYYSSVLATMGSKQDDWLRLFMMPGVAHCGGGPGPNQWNLLGALERWRESGVAPDQINAYHVTNNRVDMTRPLCPYPQVAQYKGVGSTNDAANFICKAP